MSVCVLPVAVFVSSVSGGAALVPASVLTVATCDASTSYLLSSTEFTLLTAGSLMNPDVINAELVLFGAFLAAFAVMFGLKQVYRLLVPSSGAGHE